MLSPVDDAVLKNAIAVELTKARERSAGLTDVDDEDLTRQHSPLMSPLVWDLAHVGNYEELWLLREVAGVDPLRPEIDDLYDAFEHPRAERPSLPILGPAEARDYAAGVRGRVLDVLDETPLMQGRALTASGFVYGMVIQHEHQHAETMLATHQLRSGPPILDLDAPAPAAAVAKTWDDEAFIAAGPFTMGTSDDPWAYDNERPAHEVNVDAFWIDTMPTTNEQFIAFIDDGGYERPELWSDAGWMWNRTASLVGPEFWERAGDRWFRRRFGHIEPLPMTEPVQHVGFYEADAYARWAGKRLPTEAEWEKAASWDPETRAARRYPWGDETPTAQHANLGEPRLSPMPVGSYPAGASAYGVQQMMGDVWEWTSTTFHGYPGFSVFPYEQYSRVFFGDDYRVLRGGAWATHPKACRTTFRNWDYPIRRQIFSGFRCARDGS